MYEIYFIFIKKFQFELEYVITSNVCMTKNVNIRMKKKKI